VIVFSAFCIQIGTNFANDYFDFKKGTDANRRFGPERMTQSGRISAHQMKLAFILMFSLAFFSGLYLCTLGGWPIFWIGVSAIVCGILYTGGPLPYGYIGLGEVFVFIFFGPIATAGTYYLMSGIFSKEAVIAGVLPGCLSAAILVVNNLRDREDDKKSGKRTLAVWFGKVFSRYEYAVLYFIAFLIPIYFVVSRLKPSAFALCGIVFLIRLSLIKRVFSEEGPVLNALLADTGKFLFLASLVFSIFWMSIHWVNLP